MTTARTGALSHENEYSKLKNSSSSSTEDLSQVIIPTPLAGVRRVKRLRKRKDYDCLKQKPPPKSSCIAASTTAVLCGSFLLVGALVSLGAFHYRLSQQVSSLQAQAMVTASDAALIIDLRQKILTTETLCHDLSVNVTTLSTLLSSLRSKWEDMQVEATRLSGATNTAPASKGANVSAYAGPQAGSLNNFESNSSILLNKEHTSDTAVSSVLALLTKRLADLEQTVDEYGRRISSTLQPLSRPDS